MQRDRTAYRSAVGVALATALVLAWMAAGVGVIGADGDPFNVLYLGVFAVGIIGALVARLQPRGMTRVLIAMAAAQGLVTVIALVAGKQHEAVSSVSEIVGLNGLFVALFVGSALLFRRAARLEPPAEATPKGSG